MNFSSFHFCRTKWKRQTAVGLELYVEGAFNRMIGGAGGYWPYPPTHPSIATATAAATLNPALDAYYRQIATQAALQKPLAYRVYPPSLPLLPAALQQDMRPGAAAGLPPHDPLRDSLVRPELRLPVDALRHEALRSEIIRPEALRSLVQSSGSPIPPLSASSLTVTSSIPSSPLTSPLSSSSPLSTSGSPLSSTAAALSSFYRPETSSQV